MKRLKVETMAPPVDPAGAVSVQRLYTVGLGNSVVVRFSSERQALAFQAEAGRWLTDQLFTANTMLVDAFTAYRMAWPVLPASEHKRVHIGTAVQSAVAALDRCARDSSLPDAVFRRWKALADAMHELRTVAMALRDWFVHRSDGVNRQRMELLMRRCSAMLDELKHYGTDVDTSKGFRPSPYRTD